ncbi:hypothetical protein GCM10010197_29690 [Nocardioides luteus]|uniref:TrbL/VirB6 plasmid conjugal transfer protein n=1 Tax=Nocardioides luteus TaxID=1844 RepID=A0ABQ5SR05_9ACTN|nr:hypothetical protein [Nocardioides luteus]GGR60701.1 hypothetical protein GCM10010197_29690 [Nocardioides luteus]GLJ66470.1 hypothetical protein GCM10017579_05060 [Nocardioides luteus]
MGDACNNLDAPMPASPYGDGSFIVRMTALGAASKAGTELNDPKKVDDELDPFRNKDEVSLESAYGTSPQWWTYDNGCTGQFIAGAGTSIGNIMLEISGIMPNWSHALLNAVIGENSFLKVLDDPIVTASKAVTDGVWAPWVSVVLLLVAATVMIRARDGRFARAVTAAGWALGVLVVTSWLIQYPVESTKLVDDGVRSATGLIATGFNDGNTVPGVGDDKFGETDAVKAVDGQMDEVVRSTQYRTWLAGAFGDPDSATAKKYGPRVFRSTHFSWQEYDTYRKDPNGDGKKVLEAKQDAFKKHAEAIKKSDPVAYEFFKGEHWSQRATTALVNLVVVVVVCGFLLVAGLAILLSFALIRLIVPFAPAAGVLFMLDHTRDAAVAMLKRVVGPLVMGPIYFLVALLLLRLDSAILTSTMWFVLKLGLIAVLTVLAWRLTRPAAYGIPLPGMGRLTSMLTSYVGARAGTEAGVRDAAADREQVPAGPAAGTGSVSSPGGVYMPGHELTGSTRSTMTAQQVPNQAPVTAAGALGAGAAAAGPPAYALGSSMSGNDGERVAGQWFDSRSTERDEPAYREASAHEEAASVGSAARVYNNDRPEAPSPVDYTGGYADREPEPPRQSPVAEANVDYDADGNPVFVIYSPSGNRAVPVDNSPSWGSAEGGAR